MARDLYLMQAKPVNRPQQEGSDRGWKDQEKNVLKAKWPRGKLDGGWELHTPPLPCPHAQLENLLPLFCINLMKPDDLLSSFALPSEM